MAGMNLYSVYKNGGYMGDYLAREVEELTGYSKRNVAAATACGAKIYGRYEIHKTDDHILGKNDRELLTEFEKVTREILKLAKKEGETHD